MQIKEAGIYNFGKLQNRTILLKPGVNVIYGRNEAGKTTLHEFITAMLFGMEKGRGRAASGNSYLRYEPWHSPSFYSGFLRFTVDGKPFYLERNFYSKEKKEILRNEADGEELSVAYGDLSMLLGGIGREAFGNTYDMPQYGGGSRYPGGKELSGMLAEYLADAAGSGGSGMHVTKALSLISDRKKEVNAALKKLAEENLREEQKLWVEREILERDCAGLRRETEESGRELEALRSKNPEPGRTAEKPTRRRIGLLAATAAAAVLLNAGIYLRFSYPPELFGGIELALGTVCVLCGIRLARGQARSCGKDASGENGAPGYEAAVAQAEKMLEQLKDSLLEKETRLYNIMEQTERTISGEREQRLSVEKQALCLAEEEIKRLSESFCEDMEDALNAEVSRTVLALTAGRYDSVRVTPDGKLSVLAEGREVSPEALSRGTLEQIYLALRLSVGSLVTASEPMPILLDEAFAMYDDDRLAETLKFLSGLDRQVLIFSCQKRETEILDELGITYHRVELAE